MLANWKFPSLSWYILIDFVPSRLSQLSVDNSRLGCGSKGFGTLAKNAHGSGDAGPGYTKLPKMSGNQNNSCIFATGSKKSKELAVGEFPFNSGSLALG
jgi:hypothetical protein